MAASGFTPISLYYSTTATSEPTAGNLVSGELAINIADGKLFYKNNSGNVRLLSIGYGSSTVTPTNGGVQYGTGSALALTAAGSSGQILRSNGAAAPTWADLSSLGVNTISFGSTGLTPSTATSGAVTVAGTLITSNGGTGLSSYTLGDMVYYSAGTTLTKLTIGAANRVMTSSGSAPQWVDSLTGLSSVSSTAFTENSYPVVSQSDIGTAPNEIPLNQYLGSMAYQDGDTSDITVYGVRVGRGAGAVATNTAVGASALNANTTGATNTALGYQSLQANTTASNNTAVGYQAGYSNTTGTQNIAIGYRALYSGSTAGGNIGIGENALFNATGNDNIAVGVASGYNTTTGTANTFVGGGTTGVSGGAGVANTTGSYNTAFGNKALFSNTTASYSTAVGYRAGYSYNRTSDTDGVNLFAGANSGYSVTTGNYNTFVGGINSGYYLTTGSKNTILGNYTGNQGGLDIRTASNNIVLSDGDGNPRIITDNNGLVLINRTTSAGSSVPGLHISGGSDTTSTNYTFYTVYSNGTAVFGLRNDKSIRADGVYNTTSASAANVYVDSGGILYRSTSALKYKQDIRDLEEIDINKFRSVRYKSKCVNDDQTKDHFGVIADEAADAGFEELVTRGADGEVEGFQYERLTVVLLKTIQTMKSELDSVKAELAALKGA